MMRPSKMQALVIMILWHKKMKDAFKYFMLSENCAAMISATKENAVLSRLSKLRMFLKA